MKYKKLKKELIHPWERPMRVMNIIIFIVALLVSIGFGIYALFNFDKIGEEELSASLGIFALLVVIIYFLGRQYAISRATSIQISERQFPEIYDLIKSMANQMEMAYVPEAYLVQAGGVLNAFATSFFSKKYISINAAIFELAYLEHKDIDGLKFVIAHELTHLKRKHATTGMTLIENLSSMIPIWGPAYSRVREYTCDRHAVWLAPEGKEGLILLAAGKHLYKYVDVQEYIISTREYKGLFLWLYNLTASHPIAPKRIKAIMDTSRWGKVF